MTRRGRKRKQGPRYASGGLRDMPALSPTAVARSMPHRRHIPDAAILDQRGETPFGCLAIIGAIPQHEYEAGMEYARRVNRYRSMIEAPNANPPSLAGIYLPRNSRGEPEPEAMLHVKHQLDEAIAALRKAGGESVGAVHRMTVEGEPCPQGRFLDLRRGLLRLVDHFGRDAASSRSRSSLSTGPGTAA